MLIRAARRPRLDSARPRSRRSGSRCAPIPATPGPRPHYRKRREPPSRRRPLPADLPGPLPGPVLQRRVGGRPIKVIAPGSDPADPAHRLPRHASCAKRPATHRSAGAGSLRQGARARFVVGEGSAPPLKRRSQRSQQALIGDSWTRSCARAPAGSSAWAVGSTPRPSTWPPGRRGSLASARAKRWCGATSRFAVGPAADGGEGGLGQPLVGAAAGALGDVAAAVDPTRPQKARPRHPCLDCGPDRAAGPSEITGFAPHIPRSASDPGKSLPEDPVPAPADRKAQPRAAAGPNDRWRPG